MKNFNLNIDVLINNNFYFGSRVNKWRVFMSYYLIGFRKGFFFFDLIKTSFLIKKCFNFLNLLFFNKVVIFMFLGRKFKYLNLKKKKYFNLFYLFEKYIKGFFSNFRVNKKIKKNYLPGCLVILDVKSYLYSLKEAVDIGLPIIGVCDSNMLNKFYTYIIPGNVDSIFTIFSLYLYFNKAFKYYKYKEIFYFKNKKKYKNKLNYNKFIMNK